MRWYMINGFRSDRGEKSDGVTIKTDENKQILHGEWKMKDWCSRWWQMFTCIFRMWWVNWRGRCTCVTIGWNCTWRNMTSKTLWHHEWWQNMTKWCHAWLHAGQRFDHGHCVSLAGVLRLSFKNKKGQNKLMDKGQIEGHYIIANASPYIGAEFVRTIPCVWSYGELGRRRSGRSQTMCFKSVCFNHTWLTCGSSYTTLCGSLYTIVRVSSYTGGNIVKFIYQKKRPKFVVVTMLFPAQGAEGTNPTTEYRFWRSGVENLSGFLFSPSFFDK